MRFSKYSYIVASPVPRSGRNAMQALILRPGRDCKMTTYETITLACSIMQTTITALLFVIEIYRICFKE